MRWGTVVNLTTAQETYNTYYRLVKEEVLEVLKYTVYKTHPKALTNAGLNRLANMKKKQKQSTRAGRSITLLEAAVAAYPARSRPRGQADLDSIIYHATTKRIIPPIIILKRGRILLDGVHRLLAAAYLRQPIAVVWVGIKTTHN